MASKRGRQCAFAKLSRALRHRSDTGCRRRCYQASSVSLLPAGEGETVVLQGKRHRRLGQMLQGVSREVFPAEQDECPAWEDIKFPANMDGIHPKSLGKAAGIHLGLSPSPPLCRATTSSWPCWTRAQSMPALGEPFGSRSHALPRAAFGLATDPLAARTARCHVEACMNTSATFRRASCGRPHPQSATPPP